MQYYSQKILFEKHSDMIIIFIGIIFFILGLYSSQIGDQNSRINSHNTWQLLLWGLFFLVFGVLLRVLRKRNIVSQKDLSYVICLFMGFSFFIFGIVCSLINDPLSQFNSNDAGALAIVGTIFIVLGAFIGFLVRRKKSGKSLIS
jgi:uncharacterized membrane protein